MDLKWYTQKQKSWIDKTILNKNEIGRHTILILHVNYLYQEQCSSSHSDLNFTSDLRVLFPFISY